METKQRKDKMNVSETEMPLCDLLWYCSSTQAFRFFMVAIMQK